MLEAAREAAQTDRNARSARLFAAYIRANPERRDAVLREYADQLLYSDRPERAERLFREVLAREDLDPQERREAQQGLGLALLWSGQHRRALALYDQILREDPDNERALIGRARALQWMGRPDGAREALALFPSTLRGGAEVRQLLGEVETAERPLTELYGRVSSQSDGLDIVQARVQQHFYALGGSVQIAPFYERVDYEQDGGGDADVDFPGVDLRFRFADWGEAAGRFGVEFQRHPTGDREVAVWQAGLALFPSDAMRFDLVAARRTFDNVRSIERGITADHFFASADWWPEPLWKLTARGDYATFSDGNDRVWVQAEAERQVSRNPEIKLGARATAFDFSQLLDNGYFNPDSFRSFELTASGWKQIAERTWFSAWASAGYENSDPGEGRFAYFVRAKLTHRLTDRIEASLIAESFSSRALTQGGFGRDSLIASIGWRW